MLQQWQLVQAAAVGGTVRPRPGPGEIVSPPAGRSVFMPEEGSNMPEEGSNMPEEGSNRWSSPPGPETSSIPQGTSAGQQQQRNVPSSSSGSRSDELRSGSTNAATRLHEQQEERDSVPAARQAVQRYEAAVARGGSPRPAVLLAALKACTVLRDSATATRIHAAFTTTTSAVGGQHLYHHPGAGAGGGAATTALNLLLKVYVKCGDLPRARAALAAAAAGGQRDAVSWNTVIAGHARAGGREACAQALRLYELMKRSSEGGGAREAAVTDRTLVAALKACVGALEAELPDTTEAGGDGGSRRRQWWWLERVRRVQADARRCGLETEVFVGAALVDALSKCGAVAEAREVFERMPRRNVVAWSAMIAGYASAAAEEAAAREAMRVYERMRREGDVEPNERTFVAVLKACVRLGTTDATAAAAAAVVGQEQEQNRQQQEERDERLRAVREVEADIRRAGLAAERFVGTTLLDAYSKCGSLPDARRVFQALAHRDVVAWNALILGYASSSTASGAAEALRLYECMRGDPAAPAPDARTFAAALKACCAAAVGIGIAAASSQQQLLQQVRAIHLEAAGSGAHADLFVATTLVVAYARCGDMPAAHAVFVAVPVPDAVAWTAMIQGYADAGAGAGAAALRIYYAGMSGRPGAPPPTAHTFHAALKACAALLLEEDPSATGSTGADCLRHVRAIHDHLSTAAAITPTEYLLLGTQLVDLYGKLRRPDLAWEVFSGLPTASRDAVAWTAMIHALLLADAPHAALRLYHAMLASGTAPDAHALAAAFTACTAAAALSQGAAIHQHALHHHPALLLTSTPPVAATALIHMYAKCGDMAAADAVFHSLPSPDAVAWTALLAGHALHGSTHRVPALFAAMQQVGGDGGSGGPHRPDGVAYLALLTACAHVGAVAAGARHFADMQAAGIPPGPEHRACMADLYGRAGRLDQAAAQAEACAGSSGAAWRSVLAGCAKWGAVDAARAAFERAVEVDSLDDAAYVVMGNVYAEAGRWEAAREVWERRVRAGAWKRPGRSWWTDGDGRVHAFAGGGGGPGGGGWGDTGGVWEEGGEAATTSSSSSGGGGGGGE